MKLGRQGGARPSRPRGSPPPGPLRDENPPPGGGPMAPAGPPLRTAPHGGTRRPSPGLTTHPPDTPPPATSCARARHPLDAIFRPRSVAVIGATEKEGSVGRTVLWNLISSPFGGTVFPVNPKRPSVLGIKAYPSLADIPDAVDLAVIVTPATSAPGLMAECAAKGVKGAIIISAGFREIGPEGAELERRVLRRARARPHAPHRPELPGRDEPRSGAERHLRRRRWRGPASVGFVSQSGALLTAVLDWSLRENVGFSSSSRSARCSTSAGATSSTTWATTRTRRASSSTWRPSATRAPSCRRRARSR